ncbi:MAG: hypothetical protein OXC95_14280 [Dehalococcoidia bacterium]|nr:hypothetical protein [Dehalococcoidia bacterium]
MREFCAPKELEGLADRINYSGSPYHKRNPGDFGLTPSAQPRPDKTLCDPVGIFTKSEALRLLKTGVSKGLISVQARDGLPQNIWAVTQNGHPLEAQLGSSATGDYHGYPMPSTDDFREEVLNRWNTT